MEQSQTKTDETKSLESTIGNEIRFYLDVSQEYLDNYVYFDVKLPPPNINHEYSDNIRWCAYPGKRLLERVKNEIDSNKDLN